MNSRLLPLSILITFLTLINLPAQEISYTIPDIAAPDMNVYIEIIGPHDADGNFGSDGFSMNNSSSSITVELIDAADTSKVTFSPLVVSWNGRMISTHVFVNPDVEPNSWDWEQLEDEYRIPFRVNVNGSMSDVDTIYILQPFHFGDMSASIQRVFGNPPETGKRSPRGAMIIDSAILNDFSYIITDTDYDASNEGNQALLPFILLSKGKIVGSGPNSEILGQYPNTIQHAGPGGGGGGGRFCDRALFWNGHGDDGGNGFTGGGRGGRNNVVSGGGDYKSIGMGTGPDGASLNGIPGGTAPWYEASGGGTGHPFGTSGEGCGDGNTCSPVGGFGAGSGYTQNQAGGGGGYGTDGTGSSSDNYGRAHGNDMVVPIAGGSGGASGNPQEPNECSGSGGGGGGAIRIYSRATIGDIKITANGKDGGNGVNGSHGGGGSGGHVGVHTKIGLDNVNIEAAGGRFGGAGRLRWDTPAFNSVPPPSNGETLYRSITTDTSRFAFRSDTITGSKAGNNTIIHIYMKPENGDWSELSGIENTGVNSWRIPVDLMPETDSLFYFVAMEEVANPSSEEYKMEPMRVMSQAAANIIRINNTPEIYSDTLRTMYVPNCPGATYRDTVLVENIGQHPLRVDFQDAYWTENTTDFELISPQTMKTIDPGDFERLIVQFTVDAAHSGTITGVMNLPNDDSWHDNDPYQIRYNVIIQELDFYIGERDELVEIDTVNIDLCPIDTSGRFGERSIAVRNTGEIPFRIVSSEVHDSQADIETIWVDEYQPVGAKHHGHIKYDVSFPLGHHYRTLIYSAEECPEIQDTVVVHFWVRNPKVEVTVEGDVSEVKVGSSATITVTIKNVGDVPLNYGALKPDPPFTLVEGPWWPPQTERLLIGETTKIVFGFEPMEEGDWDDTLRFQYMVWPGWACPHKYLIPITAEAVQAQVVINKDRIDFGRKARCEITQDSIIVSNPPESTTSFRILSEQITGAGAANYSLPQPVAPKTMQPGDTVVYFVKFDPSIGPEGAKYAELEIRTDDIVDSLITIEIAGFVEDMDITVDPDPVEFGFLPIGQIATESVTFTNNGRIEWGIDNITSDNPDVTINPTSGVLTANGGTAIFDVIADVNTEGEFVAELIFYFTLPCPDTLRLDVHGEGLKGEAGVTDSIDYPRAPYCESRLDSIQIINTGQTDLRIDAMAIEGAEAALFDFESDEIFPVALAPVESYHRNILFNPDMADAGVYQAFCRTDLFINGETVSDTTWLTGEISKGLTADPAEIDFGGVLMGASESRTITLTNESDWDIELDAFWFALDEPAFSINPADPIGAFLTPADDYSISVDFSPPAMGDYTDTLFIVHFDGNCLDTLLVPFMGRGTPSKTVTFRLPDTLANPRDKNFRLPVYVSSGEEDATEISNVSATISFNASLFNPREVANGGIISEKINDNKKTLRFMMDEPVAVTTDESVMTELSGSALLGNSRTMTLEWVGVDFDHSGDVSSIALIDGSFEIEICEEGGPRLLEFGAETKLSIAPNPASGRTEIDIYAAETGHYDLRIVNICGKSHKLATWDKTPDHHPERVIEFNSSGFSSGVYSLILKTPTEFIVKAIVIVK